MKRPILLKIINLIQLIACKILIFIWRIFDQLIYPKFLNWCGNNVEKLW